MASMKAWVFCGLTVAFFVILFFIQAGVFSFSTNSQTATELFAQQSMAKAAWVQVIVGILTLIGLAITVVASIRTVRAGVDAANAARLGADAAAAANVEAEKRFVLERRAWLAISDVRIVSGLTWEEGGHGRFEVEMKITNSGLTVANPTWIDVMVLVLPPGAPLPAIPTEGQSFYARSASDVGYAVFPGEVFAGNHSVVITAEDIGAHRAAIVKMVGARVADPATLNPHIHPVIVVDVHYRLFAEGQTGMTRKTFHLVRLTDGRPTGILRTEGNLGRRDLGLQRPIIGDGFAR